MSYCSRWPSITRLRSYRRRRRRPTTADPRHGLRVVRVELESDRPSVSAVRRPSTCRAHRFRGKGTHASDVRRVSCRRHALDVAAVRFQRPNGLGTTTGRNRKYIYNFFLPRVGRTCRKPVSTRRFPFRRRPPPSA